MLYKVNGNIEFSAQPSFNYIKQRSECDIFAVILHLGYECPLFTYSLGKL